MNPQTALALILFVAFGGAVLAYLAGKVSAALRNAVAVLSAAAPLVLVAALYGRSLKIGYYALPFLQGELALRTDGLAWFFAVAVAAVSLLAIVFSLRYMAGGERLDFYYFAMLLVNAGMLGVVLSADLISLFVFWEIMSWATYLLISHRGGSAVAAGLKYAVMSIFGSCAMLLAIASLYATCGTVDLAGVARGLADASPPYVLFVLLMFVVGFGIKNAIVPFHVWLPDAHSEAVSPFSAVLSSVLVRMGIYGLMLVMYGLVGEAHLAGLALGGVTFRHALCWVAAVTILIPLLIAMFQDDAKRVIAWSSIGHGGYMVLGIAFGTSLGVAGGLFHSLNYAACVALLFLAVGAVQHRTGTRDLNQLGGLMKRMPVTFAVALIGVCGLIGVPLTNGFISKWFLYKTLIIEGAPFLALIALLGTWATILYGYKLIHNAFLGQLPARHRHVTEVPVSMQVPMILLAALVILFGVLPGIAVRAIGWAQASLGLEVLESGLWALPPAVGELNTINILAGVVASLAVVWAVFSLARRARRVEPSDSYGAGAYVPTDRYQYSAGFYQRAHELVGAYIRDRVDDFYRWFVGKAEGLFDQARKVYTGNVNTYAAYVVFLLALLIVLKIGGLLW
jgi:NADH-quinone oxidoreductase subunit M